jgi:hypothetical protein
MIFLSNLVGLHFRLAQNRKRLKFENNSMKIKFRKTKSERTSLTDSESFDSFLSRNKSDDEMISGTLNFGQK